MEDKLTKIKEMWYEMGSLIFEIIREHRALEERLDESRRMCDNKDSLLKKARGQ